MYFWSDKGIPRYVVEIEVSLTRNMAKALHCDRPRGSVQPWYRLSQERILQGFKRIPMGFWNSCLIAGGH